jgi:hypothetical protein
MTEILYWYFWFNFPLVVVAGEHRTKQDYDHLTAMAR